MSNTYQINGVDLVIPPSEGQWSQRKQLGVDGYNRAIFEPVYSFQISFDGLTQDQFFQLYSFWQLMAINFSVSVTIPQKDAPTDYQYATYPGCVVDEPIPGAYNMGFQMSCKMLIRNIVL